MTGADAARRALERASEARKKSDRRPSHMSHYEHQRLQIALDGACANLREARTLLDGAAARADSK
jgi:hypothetical protein